MARATVHEKEEQKISWSEALESNADLKRMWDEAHRGSRGYEMLSRAFDLINGDRQDAYGKPEDNFGTIAEMWNSYIKARFGTEGQLEPADVAIMMTLLKVARMATCRGTYSKDSFVDAVGYTAIAHDILFPGNGEDVRQ